MVKHLVDQSWSLCCMTVMMFQTARKKLGKAPGWWNGGFHVEPSAELPGEKKGHGKSSALIRGFLLVGLFWLSGKWTGFALAICPIRKGIPFQKHFMPRAKCACLFGGPLKGFPAEKSFEFPSIRWSRIARQKTPHQPAKTPDKTRGVDACG